MEPISSRLGPHGRHGARHFRWQRLTALVNILLVAALLAVLVPLTSADHASVRAALAQPVVGFGLLLLIVVGAMHMRLGLEVVLEDYAKGGSLKTLLLLNRAFTLAIVAACTYALASIVLGS